MVLLTQLPEYWDYRFEFTCPAKGEFDSMRSKIVYPKPQQRKLRVAGTCDHSFFASVLPEITTKESCQAIFTVPVCCSKSSSSRRLKTALNKLRKVEVRPSPPSVQRTNSEKSISSLQAIHMPGHSPSPREACPALEAPAQPSFSLLTAFLTGSNSRESLPNSL